MKKKKKKSQTKVWSNKITLDKWFFIFSDQKKFRTSWKYKNHFVNLFSLHYQDLKCRYERKIWWNMEHQCLLPERRKEAQLFGWFICALSREEVRLLKKKRTKKSEIKRKKNEVNREREKNGSEGGLNVPRSNINSVSTSSLLLLRLASYLLLSSFFQLPPPPLWCILFIFSLIGQTIGS